MIEVIVFDLDDTLLDTSALLLPIANSVAFEERIRQPLPLLDGAAKNLEKLRQKYRLFLLTQGRVHFQRQKIESLGISHFFEDCLVFQPSDSENKAVFFRRIQVRTGKPAAHHLSIGNRRSTDIREAKRCGYQTCLFAHGEHLDELVTCPEDQPDFTISHHHELISTCRL